MFNKNLEVACRCIYRLRNTNHNHVLLRFSVMLCTSKWFIALYYLNLLTPYEKYLNTTQRLVNLKIYVIIKIKMIYIDD